MLLKLAWRNVWRHPGRSGIIVAAVAIGLFASAFLMAFYQGLIEQRIASVVRHETSHVQMHHPDYIADQDPVFRIPQADSLVQMLEQRPHVRSVAPRMAFPGMLQSPTGSTGLRINGVDPDREDATTGLRSALKEGDWFSAERAAGAAPRHPHQRQGGPPTEGEAARQGGGDGPGARWGHRERRLPRDRHLRHHQRSAR